MKNSKPTLVEIKEQIAKCKRIYSNLFERYKSDEEFYELNFAARLNIAKDYAADKVVLPTARDVVDSAVNHTDIQNARVFVNKKGTSDTSIERSEMLRKFALGLIHRTNVESQIAPAHVGAKHFWLHGLAVFKTVWDADRWIDKPTQNEGESENDYAGRLDEWRSQSHLSLPIVLKAVNPACIMPDPSTGGELYVIETHTKSLFDAQMLWPHWGNPLNRTGDSNVEQTSIWTPRYRCELVDNEPILKVKGGIDNHRYGFIPYTLIESGLGNMDSEALPEKRYVGILRYINDLLVSESTNYSLCDILMKQETMKGGYITGADANDVKDVKQAYGQYWPVGSKDVQFHDWEHKMAPEIAYAHLAVTADYIAGHAAPRSSRGLSEQGVRSGADRRLIQAAAAAIYDYASPAFANGWANILTKCARLVQNVIPGNFEIWTRTPTDEFDMVINKSQFKEPYNFYVEFAPISEEDEYRRQDSLLKMYNNGNGIITKAWARRQMSNVDPIAMEREEEKERLKLSPSFLQIKDQFIGQKFAEALQQSGLAPIQPPEAPPEAPGMATGGMEPPGRGMAPPIPNRAPLGSMGDMENKLKEMTAGMSSGIQTQGRGGGGNRG